MSATPPHPTTSRLGLHRRSQDQINLRVVLVAGSVIAAIGLGVRSTFGLFLNDFNEALGTETSTFALAIGIQNLIWGIGQPIAGAMADRYGSARVLASGSLVYCIGVVMMARASTGLQLYLSGGFIIGVGLSATSFAVVLASIGRRYPDNRRSTALGIATAAGSSGQFLFVQFANRLDSVNGWQTTLTVLGLVTLAIAVLAWPLRGNADDALTPPLSGRSAIDERPQQPATAEPLSSALRRAGTNRSYLLLCSGFFVCGIHVTFIATHFIPYLEDRSVSDGVAGLAWALVGLTNIVGSYAAGALGAKRPKAPLLAMIYAARGAVIVAFIVLPVSTVTVLGFGVAIGLLWLSTVPLTSAIVSQQFGTRHAGTLFGMVFFAHQLGAFAGAYGGGWLADRTGNYTASWWVAVAFAIAAAFASLFIDERPQSIDADSRSS